MIGGYQILDLRKIALSYGGSAVSITDAAILNQLRNIREYIEKGHNYKKALNNALKPYLIRYRDQKVGETKEVSEYAAIESTGSALTYKIKAKHIEIEVVFEEKTDEDDNKYYDIKTAKYVYNRNEIVEGDLSISGDASIVGNLSVEGKITGGEIVEDMEGYSAIASETDTDFEVEPVYAGAVKNGNKLTLVYAVNVTKLTSTNAKMLINFTLPSNIGAKIYPSFLGDNTLLDSRYMNAFSSRTNAVNVLLSFYKISNTNLRLWLENSANMVVNTKYYIRFETTFLLSDNLIPQE